MRQGLFSKKSSKPSVQTCMLLIILSFISNKLLLNGANVKGLSSCVVCCTVWIVCWAVTKAAVVSASGYWAAGSARFSDSVLPAAVQWLHQWPYHWYGFWCASLMQFCLMNRYTLCLDTPSSSAICLIVFGTAAASLMGFIILPNGWIAQSCGRFYFALGRPWVFCLVLLYYGFCFCAAFGSACTFPPDFFPSFLTKNIPAGSC